MLKQRFWVYLLFALGEVVLVVIGILIAVRIENANDREKAKAAELESYANIILDLKKDSVQFEGMSRLGKVYIDTYYQVYGELSQSLSYDQSIAYDLLGATQSFAPRTKINHQGTIDKISNQEIRKILNNYFQQEFEVEESFKEFNDIVLTDSRPYLFRNGAIDISKVFHDNKYGFFPKQGGITNYVNLTKCYTDIEFAQSLSAMRIAMGRIVVNIEELILRNSQLIETLNLEITKNKTN